jgi:hypothetical protein
MTPLDLAARPFDVVGPGTNALDLIAMKRDVVDLIDFSA